MNLKGVFLCTRAVTPHMIAAGGGVVLNASSVVGLYGNFGQTAYAAAKAGVVNMTRTWARELGKHNIRVNAVAPGFIETDMTAKLSQEVRDRMMAAVPLKRFGQPDDTSFARWMIDKIGLATVPGSSFYRDKELGRTKIRFCFCKKDETLDAAAERLAKLGRG